MRYRSICSVVLGLCAVQSWAWAGANNAELSCTDKAGKTLLTGNIPGDFAEFKLTFSPGTNSLVYSEEQEEIVVAEDFSRKVFTASVMTREGGVALQLLAYPDTMQVKSASDPVEVTFSGQLKASSPGVEAFKQPAWAQKPYPVKCTYHHGI